MTLIRFQLDQSLEMLSAHSGLALIGSHLSRTHNRILAARCALPLLIPMSSMPTSVCYARVKVTSIISSRSVGIGFSLNRKASSTSPPLPPSDSAIERTMEADGQLLLVPQVEVQVFFPNLTCSPWQVIRLYRDHSTSEQSHSELMTDLNLERLPSVKFATNNLVLCAGLFALDSLFFLSGSLRIVPLFLHLLHSHLCDSSSPRSLAETRA